MTTRQDRRRRTGDANPPADVAAGEDRQSERPVPAGVEFAPGPESYGCAESGGRAPDDGRAHLSSAFVGVRWPGRRHRSIRRCVPAGFRCCRSIHVPIRRLRVCRVAPIDVGRRILVVASSSCGRRAEHQPADDQCRAFILTWAAMPRPRAPPRLSLTPRFVS